ncbi:helix-turn-helix DNA binding domain protein [Microbacterium phage ClearAsMud]|uniref:Helix-turn-helix DNA binding domain protein n=2 Tax=Quhwahvirus TaxID=2733202 RepID=A0A899ISA1_9CAUD|nr:helix-turn-helix DNA binding domain protein [Microbacterium phage ClearAsMud]YP_010751721.1 helix-turn-helix DNA binding domain protein [Microbacterium phage NoodlelyBoi]QNL30280.1 helix-turn-helix DNA binding domain protein [Microbacterium phage ClearAsMud]QSM01261.1 helix-turn-helix DNA binding domain protein [Microbacterium phage NoodlelyBoi]
MSTQSNPLEMVGLADIATILGLSPASVRTYHTDATRRRRNGEARDQDMPAPDTVIGRTPAWKRESIDAWNAERKAAAQRNLDRLRQPRGPRTPEPVA